MLRCTTYLDILSVLLMAGLLGSCQSDTDTDASAGSDDVKVMFTLTMADPVAGTRAANTSWTDYDPKDMGTTFENAIDVSKLSVYFYDVDYNFVARVHDVTLSPVSGSANQYYVLGYMPVKNNQLVNNNFTGKMAVFANMQQPDSTVKLTSTAVTTASYNYSNTPSVMPMWGMQNVSIDLKPGVRNTLPDVNLLRSMAKVTVELSSEMQQKGWSLNSVVLNAHNMQGYCMPAGNSIAKAGATEALTFAQSFHPLASASTDGIQFTGKPLYIPEYDNTTTGVTPATITLTLSKGSVTYSDSYTLKFVQYDDNDQATTNAYDIVRNHWYRFTVYKLSEHDIDVKLQVKPWNEVDHDPIIM